MLGSAIGCGILLGKNCLVSLYNTNCPNDVSSIGVFEGVGVLVGRLFAETNKPVTPLIPEVRTNFSKGFQLFTILMLLTSLFFIANCTTTISTSSCIEVVLFVFIVYVLLYSSQSCKESLIPQNYSSFQLSSSFILRDICFLFGFSNLMVIVVTSLLSYLSLSYERRKCKVNNKKFLLINKINNVNSSLHFIQ